MSNRRHALRGIARRKGALVGLSIIVLVAAAAALAPLAAGRDPLEQTLPDKLRPPGPGYVLGTDSLGRDLRARLVWGSRISLVVGVASVAIAAVIGTGLGLAAGYFRGWVDTVVTRVIEVLMSFPLVLLAIAIVAVLGGGLRNLMIAVGISSIPPFARLVRGQVLVVGQRDFVEAARAVGAGSVRVMARHILPNIASAVVVLGTLRISTVILTEASLSFLGLGISPPTATWGSMIADGVKWLRLAPWVSIVPGVAIMITVLAFNLFGDGLRDALDPRLRGE